MNLLSWDEIARLVPIACLAAANILVAYWLGARVFEKHIKYLQSKIDGK